MTSVAMRCSSQAGDTRAGRGSQNAQQANKAAAAQRRAGHCTGQATISGGGATVGVTVSLSAKSLASVAGLAHSAVKLGSEGAQLVGDAAKATADVAGEVLERGVMAGVVGAALVSVLV